MTGVGAPGPGGEGQRPRWLPDGASKGTPAHRHGPVRRLVRRVGDHLHRRLVQMERAEPDGAVAGWRWMWRALERSSSSVWRLRLRFTARVVADLALLGVWWCLRPISLLRRGSPRRAILTAATLALVCGFLWMEEQRAGPRLPYAHLEVHASGLLTFSGQKIRTRELSLIVDHYRISVLDISLDDDVSAGTAFAVQDILVDAGIPRVKFRMAEREDDLRTRR